MTSSLTRHESLILTGITERSGYFDDERTSYTFYYSMKELLYAMIYRGNDCLRFC
jgi:hypothetical protein